MIETLNQTRPANGSAAKTGATQLSMAVSANAKPVLDLPISFGFLSNVSMSFGTGVTIS